MGGKRFNTSRRMKPRCLILCFWVINFPCVKRNFGLSLSYYWVCLKSLSDTCHKIPIWSRKVEFQWLSSGFAKTSSHVCLACGGIRLTGIGACRGHRRRRSGRMSEQFCGTFLNRSWLLSEFNLNFAGMTKSPQCEFTGLIRVIGRRWRYEWVWR